MEGLTPAMMRAAARFFAKVRFNRADRPNGCWTWTGARQNDKRVCYGLFRKSAGSNARIVAHKFAFQLAGKKLAPGEEIGHTCHNELCVRPDHLKAIDHPANVREIWTEGKGARKRAAAAARAAA